MPDQPSNTQMMAHGIVVGAGLAGLVAAAELVDAGKRVIIVEQEPEASFGGQAWWSFGGLFLVDSPEQRRMGVNGVRLADRAELAAPLVHHQPHPAQRLESATEARFHPPNALGNGAHAAAVGRVEVQHAIGLAVADRAQHDRLCLKRARHGTNTL